MIEWGLVTSGLKMTWNGLKWAFQRNAAPWSAADVSAVLRSNDEGGWHGCSLRFVNDKPFVLEIREIKTVKPSGLMISLVDNEMGGQRDDTTEAVIKAVRWDVSGRTDRASQLDRTVFVDLSERKKRPIDVTFQLKATLRDNRRTSFTVLARTNKID
jgi:hypothetical protein